MFAVPNGGSRNTREARNLKLQGVMPGVSDLIFLFPGRGYHGLCIEMKFGKGKQTQNQKEWGEAVEKFNYKYIVINNFDDFFKLINWYVE